MRVLLLALLFPTLALAAEDTAAHRAEVAATVSKTVEEISARADRGVTAAESALLLRASGFLTGVDREHARDALVRAWDAKLERPATAADADLVEGLLDAWQASSDERFRQAATEALARAAAGVAAAPSDHPLALAELARLTAALARGGAVLASPEALTMARRAEKALIAAIGEQTPAADLDAAARAGIALYECGGDGEALASAVDAQDRLDRGSWDESAKAYKGEVPFAALDLVLLGRITDDDGFIARGRALAGAGDPLRLCALIEDSAPVLHLTLIGRPDEAGTAALLAAAHRRAVPGFVIATLDEGDASRALRRRFPAMPLMPRSGKAPTAYLCTAAACDPPTTSPEALAQRIGELAGR